MAQSTMILPFSIQSKFQDYFEGIVRDFCICIFKRLTDAVRGRVIIHHTCTRHATFINNTSYQTNHLSIIHLLDWTDDKTSLSPYCYRFVSYSYKDSLCFQAMSL